ncbi:MAG TPA: precorrin-6A synthase (deacetylating) [Mycobacterium sp.]|nr:precorrin-6A synthase (deacetylating) [Mycobacterium sp.]
MRRIHVIGIGAGDPEYLTAQAISALNDTQVFFVMYKGEDKADLVGMRRHICQRFISEDRHYRFVDLADPPRASTGDYRQSVTAWHAARARLWADAITAELPSDGVGAFLAWGDPTLYDSTIRVLEAVATHLDIDYDVIPGITAIQALTARHRIPLNDIGEPVLITTGRRLSSGFRGTAVVMLDGECAFRKCPPETRIWWGAYLGTEHELLVAGTVGDVGDRIALLRREARAQRGWIMDTYILRSAISPTRRGRD